MKILCIGMMVCDTMLSPVPFDILKQDSISIEKPSTCCGGDALNAAMGLSKLGNKVSIIGRIGKDASGKFILKECEKNRIDTTFVAYDEECATAASYALVDTNGERHFLSEKSIFAKLEGADIPDEAIKKVDLLYFGSAMAMKKMDECGIEHIFSRAHKLGKLTAMDAAFHIEDEERDWLSYLEPAFAQTDIFFPSMSEAIKITGESVPEKIAAFFRPFSMKIFGIKMGAAGCFVTNFKESRFIECPKGMPVVDTTGAGDSFMAGLLRGLANEWDAFTAAEFAVCVATQNVGALGGTTGIPDFDHALRFYQAYKKSMNKTNE